MIPTRLFALVLIICQFTVGAAAESAVEKIKGPVLILKFSEISDRDEGSHSYVTSLGDGWTSIHSRAVVFRDREAFDKELEEMIRYKGEPTINQDDFKTWETADGDAGGASTSALIFISPFSRGGPSAQSMAQVASLTEFNKITEIFPSNYNVEDAFRLLNELLKTNSDLRLISVLPEEFKLGKYSSEGHSYYLSR